MVKLPVMGRVKTRLARDVGRTEATRFYRTTCATVVQRLARQPFWETWLSVSPDAGNGSATLPRPTRRMAQGGGDLGARMQRPMRTLPPGPVCVVGTDIPAITIDDIRRAFAALGTRPLVFGPAEDGGFWLVGQRRRPRLLWPYAGVEWSREDTLARVLANVPADAAAFTTTLSDVDSARDLRGLAAHVGRRVPPVSR